MSEDNVGVVVVPVSPVPASVPPLSAGGSVTALLTVIVALAPPNSTGSPFESPAVLTEALIVQVPAPTAEKLIGADEFDCPAASPITTIVSFPPANTDVLSTLIITSTPYPDGQETVTETVSPTFTVLALTLKDTLSAFTTLFG